MIIIVNWICSNATLKKYILWTLKAVFGYFFFWFLTLKVAYVLGQLQNKSATDALSGVLKDVHEHPMVRHEAAEALGSIAGLTLGVSVLHGIGNLQYSTM